MFNRVEIQWIRQPWHCTNTMILKPFLDNFCWIYRSIILYELYFRIINYKKIVFQNCKIWGWRVVLSDREFILLYNINFWMTTTEYHSLNYYQKIFTFPVRHYMILFLFFIELIEAVDPLFLLFLPEFYWTFITSNNLAPILPHLIFMFNGPLEV